MKQVSTYHEVDLQLLKRYFNDTCTKSEEKMLIEWFRNPDYEKALLYKIKEHWEEFDEIGKAEFNSERILDKIHHKMHLDDWKKSQEISGFRKFFKVYSKIAAAILLPLLILGGAYFSKGNIIKADNVSYAEVYSPPGARTHFHLPDGSSGWLNSGSTLRFPAQFTGSTREVSLLGEGYFDVSHNPENPFVISTGQSEVHALGTSFNVMAWQDESQITVTMESGLTVVYGLDKKKNKTKISELRKGEQLVYSTRDHSCLKKDVNSESFTSWKDGKLIFRNEPMDEVLKKIGRWYNVHFIVDNREIDGYRYRATFKDETLDEVLKLLEHTSPIGYEELEREILSDGTYSRKRIRLFISQ